MSTRQRCTSHARPRWRLRGGGKLHMSVPPSVRPSGRGSRLAAPPSLPSLTHCSLPAGGTSVPPEQGHRRLWDCSGGSDVGGASHFLAGDLRPCNFNKLNLKKGKRSPGSRWIIHSYHRVSRRTPLWRVSNSYSLISPPLQDPQVRIQFRSQKREENLTNIFLNLSLWVISEFANWVAIGDSILKNNFERLVYLNLFK